MYNMPYADHCTCVLRDDLRFTLVIQGWGPKASPLIIRCTTHLEDYLLGILFEGNLAAKDRITVSVCYATPFVFSGVLHFQFGFEARGRRHLTDTFPPDPLVTPC
eukprot:8282189-Pyramimonas_sp.AAC.1